MLKYQHVIAIFSLTDSSLTTKNQHSIITLQENIEKTHVPSINTAGFP